MGYLFASKRFLIDKSTHQFIPITRKLSSLEIDIPFYFWESARSLLRNRTHLLHRTHRIQLNGCSVEFTKFMCKGEMPLLDSHSALIKYSSGQTTESYHMNVKPTFGNINYIDMNDTQLRCVDYVIWKDMGSVPDFSSDFFGTPTSALPRFNCLYDMGYVKTQYNAVSDMFFYGLSDQQYQVCYRGKKLNGKSYVMMCGTWGVLLGDDLSFDSIVSFCGVEDGCLYIDNILHTINPYIIKVKTLVK